MAVLTEENVEFLKSFLQETELPPEKEALRLRVSELNDEVGLGREKVQQVVANIKKLEEEFNKLNSELFSKAERLDEVCNLVIQTQNS